MLFGSLDGRSVWGRTETSIHMAESLHCSAITPLLIAYIPVQNLKKKRLKEVTDPGSFYTF